MALNQNPRPGDLFQPSASLERDIRNLLRRFKSGGFGGNESIAAFADPGQCPIFNDASEDVDRFGALIVQKSEAGNYDKGQWEQLHPLSAIKPDGPLQNSQKIVITQQKILDGSIGQCRIAGVSLATVDIQDESHVFADTQNDSTVLVSDSRGPLKIIDVESGTGEKLALVYFGGFPLRKKIQAPAGGVPPRNGTTPGSTTCNVIEVENGVLTATGETLTIYSWSTVATAATGDRYGSADLNSDGLWFIDADDCMDGFSLGETGTFTNDFSGDFD